MIISLPCRGGVSSTWFCVNPEKKSAAILMTQLIPSSLYPIRCQLRYLFNEFVSNYENSNE